ncbi:hypothetical protein [Legionella nagasakiensis]|uniref:hypothetical protein n=1 Tax=Legionella nagasakiensis TaxID=535290 RepID=UPI00105594A1|nr:hypothetical protein [Legionella nagasakiensis]
MYIDQKISIYKGIIQYLLDSTAYPLQRIANLSNSSAQHLQAIYERGCLPNNSNVEINLLKLFTTIIDMELKDQWKAHYKNARQ